MTDRKGKSGTIDVKALLAGDEEFLRALVRTALQEVLKAEMTEALGAEKSERAVGRLGYRSGYYGRTLITRIGKLELRVPQDRAGLEFEELERPGADRVLAHVTCRHMAGIDWGIPRSQRRQKGRLRPL